MFRQEMALLIVLALMTCSASSGGEACRAQSQSYSRCRMLAAHGLMIPAEEIRVDEWINYMDYRFPNPIHSDGQDRVGLWGVTRLSHSESGSSAFVLLVMRTAPYLCQREQPLDLVIVLDRSGSMSGGNKMTFAAEGIRKLTLNLAPGDRVGLLGFDTAVSVERRLSAWKPGDDLSSELQRLQPRGGTDMNLGLQEGMKMLLNAPSANDPEGGPERVRRLLVITDAQTNTGECNVERVIKGLEPGFKAGVRMTSIGVGLSYNDALLSRLTRIPGNNGRFLDRADEIEKSLQILFDAVFPLDVDKPRLTLDLPAGVSVKQSFGTPYGQSGSQANFPKLTSMGVDDHQVILLRLEGNKAALRQIPGAKLALDAYSPMQKRVLRLQAEVKAVGASANSPQGAKTVPSELVEGFHKARTVALAADALRRAARCAEKKDFSGTDKAVREAEDVLHAYKSGGKDPEIEEVRAMVMLDRKILLEMAKVRVAGTLSR